MPEKCRSHNENEEEGVKVHITTRWQKIRLGRNTRANHLHTDTTHSQSQCLTLSVRNKRFLATVKFDAGSKFS